MGRTKAFISASDILFLTNQGRDIFEREIGFFTEKENIKSPLRTGDENPSFRIRKSSSGIYYAKDYGGEQWSGNAIDFVQKLYNIDFKEACKKIIADFNLDKNVKSKNYEKVLKLEKEEKKEILKETVIDFEIMPFTKRHHEYWNRAELSEDFLKQYDIYAVKKWAVNKKVQPFTEGQITFAYWASDINKTKILNIGPNVEKKNKWRTDIPNSYLWYYSNYNTEIKDFVISKSVKDLMILYAINFEGVATQSENDIVLMSNMGRIKKISESPIIVFGSDKQGVESCKKVQQTFNTRYYNTPKNLLSLGINDPFSYVCEFGLKSFEKHFKNKLKL